MAAVLSTAFEKLLISSCKQQYLGLANSFIRSPALTCGLRTQPSSPTRLQQQPAVQQIIPRPKSGAQIAFKEIASKINTQINDRSHGRLFAVVHVCGKQFKVTDEDLIVIQGSWAPEAGDKIRLEKVLLIGGTDFTLLGRPMLPKDLVHVEATVVEKTLSHTKTVFRKKRRKQYMRINFYRIPETMLRINAVRLIGKVDSRQDISKV